jgi:predicted membrane-bound mannosyltransferase
MRDLSEFTREKIIVLVVAIISFISIYHSYSLAAKRTVDNDEIFHTKIVKSVPSVEGIITEYQDLNEPTQPTFTIVLFLIAKVTDGKDLTFRLLPIIFYIFSMISLMYISKKVIKNKYWGIPTILFCISPAMIWFSQYIRPYMIFLFFSLWASYFHYLSLKNAKYNKWLLFVVFLTLSNIHLSGLIYSLIIIAMILHSNGEKRWGLIYTATTLPSIYYFLSMFSNLSLVKDKVAWIAEPSLKVFYTFLYFPLISYTEKVELPELWIFRILVLGTIWILMLVSLYKLREHKEIFVAFILPSSLLILTYAVMSFTVTPLLIPRYSLTYTPVLFLFSCLAITNKKR